MTCRPLVWCALTLLAVTLVPHGTLADLSALLISDPSGDARAESGRFTFRSITVQGQGLDSIIPNVTWAAGPSCARTDLLQIELTPLASGELRWQTTVEDLYVSCPGETTAATNGIADDHYWYTLRWSSDYGTRMHATIDSVADASQGMTAGSDVSPIEWVENMPVTVVGSTMTVILPSAAFARGFAGPHVESEFAIHSEHTVGDGSWGPFVKYIDNAPDLNGIPIHAP
jgi:hypothetical protein